MAAQVVLEKEVKPENISEGEERSELELVLQANSFDMDIELGGWPLEFELNGFFL